MSLRPSLLKSYTMPINILNRKTRRGSDVDEQHWKSRSVSGPASTSAKRRLRHLTRYVPLRRLKLVFGVIALITIILIAIPSRHGPERSYAADAKHLDQLVSRFRAKLGALDIRDTSQAFLGPPSDPDDPSSSRGAEKKSPHRKGGIVGDVFVDQDELDDWEDDDMEEEEKRQGEGAEEPAEGLAEDIIELEEDDVEDEDEDEDVDGNDGAPPASKPYHGQYRQLFSLTTDDRKYFKVHFGGPEGYNPTIVPHPFKHDLWIVAAQNRDKVEQITCTAGFLDGTLTCTDAPETIQTEPSLPGTCTGVHGHYNLEPGARDARIFYGPTNPYIMYGSQSQYTCLGMWLEDLRMLLEPYAVERDVLVDLFKGATEVKRPSEWKDIEKNYFLFVDDKGKLYVHHDIWPKRTFAQIDFDGSVGDDLAPLAANRDAACIANYMPRLRSTYETLQQTSNSLQITNCKRKDPGCKPTNENTFIATIMHHKSFYDFHAVFEPYLVLFNVTAPFHMYGISQYPFWIHGRTNLTTDSFSRHYEGANAANIPEGHSEAFYITGMSWKTHGQKYQGYIDDPLLLSFGIEDTRGAAIDVLPSNLLQDIATC